MHTFTFRARPKPLTLERWTTRVNRVSDRREAFRAASAVLQRQVLDWACPIYGVRGDNAQHLGSGFLLDVGGRLLLITAAHVLENRKVCTLQIPGQSRIVPMEGESFSTGVKQPPDGCEDVNDVAFMILDTHRMMELPRCPALKPCDLDVNDLPANDTAYGFVGYPSEANPLLPERVFDRTVYYYGGTAGNRSKYEIFDYDPRAHFIMNFDRARMMNGSGDMVSVPRPTGMSGGPVFKLGTIAEIEAGTARPRVIALLVDWAERLKVLSSIRIAIVTELIRQLLPETVTLLSPSPYLPTMVIDEGP